MYSCKNVYKNVYKIVYKKVYKIVYKNVYKIIQNMQKNVYKCSSITIACNDGEIANQCHNSCYFLQFLHSISKSIWSPNIHFGHNREELTGCRVIFSFWEGIFSFSKKMMDKAKSRWTLGKDNLVRWRLSHISCLLSFRLHLSLSGEKRKKRRRMNGWWQRENGMLRMEAMDDAETPGDGWFFSFFFVVTKTTSSIAVTDCDRDWWSEPEWSRMKPNEATARRNRRMRKWWRLDRCENIRKNVFLLFEKYFIHFVQYLSRHLLS